MIFPELLRPFTAPVTSLHHFVPSATVTKRCVTSWQVCSRAFPDFDIEQPRLQHAGETVVVECVVTGTRHRSFAGVPPTGRRIEVPLVANFDFDGDLLIGEKVNFDLATLMRQLERMKVGSARSGFT